MKHESFGDPVVVVVVIILIVDGGVVALDVVTDVVVLVLPRRGVVVHNKPDPVQVVAHAGVDRRLPAVTALGTVAEEPDQFPAPVIDHEGAAGVAGANAAPAGRVPHGMGTQLALGLLVPATIRHVTRDYL